jgi:hypothetical protein
MSSEGPYGRHGFNANAGGYNNNDGGGYGQQQQQQQQQGGYAQPQYNAGASYGGGASYSAPTPQGGYGSSQYGGYGDGYSQVRLLIVAMGLQVLLSSVVDITQVWRSQNAFW